MDHSSRGPAETEHAPFDGNDALLDKRVDGVDATPEKPRSRKSRSPSPQSETQDCEICYLSYDKDRKPQPCTHCKKSFCKECWTTWRLTQPKINGDRAVTCPNCRQQIIPLDPRAIIKHARPFAHSQRSSVDANARARQRMDRRRSGVNHMLPQRHHTHSSSMYGPFQQTNNVRSTPWFPAPTLYAAQSQYQVGYYGPSPPASTGFHYAPSRMPMIHHQTPTMMHNSPALYNTNPTPFGPPNYHGYQPAAMIRPPNHYTYGFSPPSFHSTFPGPQYVPAQMQHSVPGHPCPAMNGSARASNQVIAPASDQSDRMRMSDPRDVSHPLPPRPQPSTDSGFYLPPPTGMFPNRAQYPHGWIPQGSYPRWESASSTNTDRRAFDEANTRLQSFGGEERHTSAGFSASLSQPRAQGEHYSLTGSNL